MCLSVIVWEEKMELRSFCLESDTHTFTEYPLGKPSEAKLVKV